jgi:hypothetical protein
MTPERTELEWIYKPADLFEAPYQHPGVEFDILADAGRAVATLRVPQDPVSPDVEERVRAVLGSIFLVRQLQIQRKYSLEGPRIYQHTEGRKNILLRVESRVAGSGRAD